MALSGCPVQRGRHEFSSNSIAISAKLQEILHNLTAVVDCSPVEECYILLISLVDIETSLDNFLNSAKSSILGGFHNVKATGILLFNFWSRRCCVNLVGRTVVSTRGVLGRVALPHHVGHTSQELLLC